MPAPPLPRTSIRVAMMRALLERLDAHGNTAGVTCALGWPGPNETAERIYVGRAKGRPTIESHRAGRQVRTDAFDVGIWFVVATPGIAEAAHALDRAEFLYAALEDVLAEQAVDLRGRVKGLVDVAHGEVDGPAVEPTANGWRAFVFAEVACTARLT